MTLLLYIDNEVPWDAPNHYGEWDAAVEEGSSSIVRCADASWPDRGQWGLRCRTVLDQRAYVEKTSIGHSIESGESVFVAFWLNVLAPPASYNTIILRTRNAANGASCGLYLYSTGRLRLRAYDDGGVNQWTDLSDNVSAAGWVFVQIELRRHPSAGYGKLWVAGSLVGQTATVDNSDLLADLDVVAAGCRWFARDGLDIYLDEFRAAEAYVEPFVPQPEGELPCPQRTAVLYRPGDDDSRDFARYCVEKLGVPLSNMVPLPDAAGDETLPDYATFEQQVEDAVEGYLALNPTVASNCSCFLLGYGVPGYFMHAGVKHSAVSRLMRFGQAFAPGTDNPLYAPSSVERLTAGMLQSAGVRLAVRIDAPTLSEAKALVDRSLAVKDMAALVDADKLYTDETDFLGSLSCQKLRIATVEGTAGREFADDAVVFGDTQGSTFGAAGTRAVFVDTSGASADSLRGGGSACVSALQAGYAAALGSAGPPDGFDARAFFEMVRAGGTFAEACAVAVASLDFTAVAAGDPLATVPFARAGVNVYAGVGGPEDIDWTTPAAYLRADQDVATVSVEPVAGLSYVFGARAVSAAGVQERNTHVLAYAQVDTEGNLLGPPLARPGNLAATVFQDGSVRLEFSHHVDEGHAAPHHFHVFTDEGTGAFDLESPLACISADGAEREEYGATLTPSVLPARFAVRAATVSRTGPLSRPLLVAQSPSPLPATAL